MRMSELLNEVRNFSLDEGFSPREIKMAIGIASDPRYAKGNMTGAVTAIERMKKGLSKHPQVAAVLQRQNEDVKVEEAVSPTHKMPDGTVMKGKKHKDEKDEGNEFGLDEAPKMTYALVGTDMKIYAIDSDEKNMKLNRRSLEKRFKDVSPLKIARLKTAQSIGDTVDKSQLKEETLDEEVEIDEAMSMTDPKLLKMFDKLKSKDTVKIKYDSTLEKGTDFIEFTVKSKGTVRNGQVEKITLAAKGNPMAAKRFMYKKDGKVTFATGDMAASIVDIKESIKRALLKLESVEIDEASKEGTIKIIKTKDGKFQIQKMTKGKFVDIGKPYNSAKEAEKFRSGQPDLFGEEVDLDEAKILDNMSQLPKGVDKPLKSMQLVKKDAEIMGGMKLTHIVKNKQGNKVVAAVISNGKTNFVYINNNGVTPLKEEVDLDEKYDLYHKDFSSAMQHAYDYAKSKMGITVDPKEIDSKVATGPKKPTEGKTNKYMLKGKGGNLQIQVYNKGGSKPFELNMYKEENALIAAAVGYLSND